MFRSDFLLYPCIVFIILLMPVVVVPTTLHAEEMAPIPMISGIEMLDIGSLAPDFTISDIEGTPFSMKAAINDSNGMLIFFWSIFCEPCKAELPIIQELTEEYTEKGIKFVGVIIDGTPMKDAVAAFVSQEGYAFRTLLDELSFPEEVFKVSDPYGVAGTPTLYIVDNKGIVRFGKVGRVPKEELDAAIKQIL